MSWFANSETLVGSSTNLKSLPKAAVFANSTTTDASLTDGGSTIDQAVTTDGYDTVLLNISAIGPTATTTIYIRQMGSQDDSNYFDIASSTEQWANPTTTVTFEPKTIQLDPGTATSTISYPFTTTGYKYTRFIMWSEGWTGDNDTGAQAWITAIKVEPFNK